MALIIHTYETHDEMSDHLHRFFLQQQKAQLFGVQPRLITLSQPINRWVNYHIVQTYGATLDIPCHLMEDGLWDMFREVSPIALPPAIKFQQWLMRLVSLLSDDTFMSQSVMAPIQNYLQNSPNQNGATSKKVGLAQSLLLLFQDYEQRNPSLLADWPETPLAQAERELYLHSCGGSPCSLAHAFTQICQSVPQAPAEPGLTVLFGFPSVLDGQWQMLNWAAQVMNVELLLHHPLRVCPDELASWDRPTQQFLQSVGWSGPQMAPDSSQTLASLQKMLQSGHLSVLAAKGTDREYDAVANRILQMLEDDPSLLPQQIAVLCSDVSEVKSLLCAAFDKHQASLPYCVLGVRAGDSLYIQALQALLALSSDNFTRSQLLAVMRNPCFMQAQGITHSVVDNWQELMANSGAWRGYDQLETAYAGIEEQPFSFKQMMQRYRLGRLLQIPNEQQADHWQHRIPEATFRTSAQELESLGICLERMNELSELLSGAERAAGAWAEALARLLPLLIEPQPDDAPDRRGHMQMQQTLRQMADGEEMISTQVLPAAEFKQLLTGCIRPDSWHIGVPVLGGVNVGTLNQLGGVPFRHVIVCGLNEGRFPLRVRASSLDIRTDTGGQAEDIARQSLLTALLSASDSITLSYQELDPVTDTPGYLSNQLRQLLEYLGIPDVSTVTRHVPLMPYSIEHLLVAPDGKLPVWPNYSLSDWLIALKQLSHSELASPELAAQATTALDKMVDIESREEAPLSLPEAPRELSVRQLSSFLYDPITSTLERLAGRIWESAPEDTADTEPLELTAQQISRMVTQAVLLNKQTGRPVRAITAELYHAGSHRGLLPVAPMEPVLIASIQQKSEELAAQMPLGDLCPVQALIDVEGITVTADWPLCVCNEQGDLVAVKMAQGKKNSGKLHPFAIVQPALALLVYKLQHQITPLEVSVWVCWSGEPRSEQFTISFEDDYLALLVNSTLAGSLWHLPYPLILKTGIETGMQEIAEELDAEYGDSVDPLSWVEGITQPESDELLRSALYQRFAPFVVPQKSQEDDH